MQNSPVLKRSYKTLTYNTVTYHEMDLHYLSLILCFLSVITRNQKEIRNVGGARDQTGSNENGYQNNEKR